VSSGVAPRARIAAYKVCWEPRVGGGGCAGADSAAAIDQAVAAGVDVINFSIGGASTVFAGVEDIAFLYAAAAGASDARSPIAVRTVELDAPAEVAGSGDSGVESLAIGFGYAGDYEAGVHGLVTADETPGAVGNDPYSDINAALGSCDFSSFPYACTGLTWHVVGAESVVTRIALFDNHTDGADSNYTLFSWSPTTDEGDLTVTAPGPSVLLGEVGTVTVECDNLVSGKYMGAISHNKGSVLIGGTAVTIEVD
jgi:hypothetical protein